MAKKISGRFLSKFLLKLLLRRLSLYTIVMVQWVLVLMSKVFMVLGVDVGIDVGIGVGAIV